MTRSVRFVSVLVFVAVVAVAPAAADVWQIDGAHPSARFSVTHLMISTMRGEFDSMSGTVEFDGKSIASIKVDATIDATSMRTRDEKRDGHLKSPEVCDVAKHPTLTFKSTKVVPGSGGAFKLVGDLTMDGVTKEVTLDATGPSQVIKGMRGESRVVVSDTVAITLDIEAKLSSPTAPAASAPAAAIK